MRFAVCLLVAFVCSGAFASEPGQPLDCSDWEIHLPGISCTTVVPYPCSYGNAFPCDVSWGANIDNEGNGFYVSYEEQPGSCVYLGRYYRWNIFRTSPQGASTLVASVLDRCVDGYADGILNQSVAFDAIHGRLVVTYRNTSYSYDSGYQRIAFGGFATLFDVLQTYTPQSAGLGFRVPYMPEGMAAADRFDTYWGPLTHPLDFTQARPLQCNYPATAPHVGDYLSVADTVPTPAPGQGVYYVTSATYQDATRYGRKTSAAHLTGRDPALLPACTP